MQQPCLGYHLVTIILIQLLIPKPNPPYTPLHKFTHPPPCSAHPKLLNLLPASIHEFTCFDASPWTHQHGGGSCGLPSNHLAAHVNGLL